MPTASAAGRSAACLVPQKLALQVRETYVAEVQQKEALTVLVELVYSPRQAHQCKEQIQLWQEPWSTATDEKEGAKQQASQSQIAGVVLTAPDLFAGCK